jgi:hypothetical protein
MERMHPKGQNHLFDIRGTGIGRGVTLFLRGIAGNNKQGKQGKNKPDRHRSGLEPEDSTYSAAGRSVPESFHSIHNALQIFRHSSPLWQADAFYPPFFKL